MRLSYLTCAFIVLAACLSCDKQPKEEQPLPTKTTRISYEENLSPEQLFPELDKLPSVRYDEQMGYYIFFDHMEWTHPWSCGPAFIPAQSSPFSAKADRVVEEEFSGWYARYTSYVVLKDIHLPEQASKLTGGDCPAMFKLHISLGEDVPYRKVTLEDLAIHFPSWFRAELADAEYGSIPKLEVTAEGVDLSVRLHGILEPVQFVDVEGRLDYSLETVFDARVSVSPEDALDPAAETPSVLDFRCTFEFDRIDFTRCFLVFPEIGFIEMTFTWNAAELPSFLGGNNSNVTLTQPRILFEYWSDFPLSESHMDVTALYGDGKAAFSIWDNAKYMLMAQEDAVYREGINNRGIKALATMFRGPFPDGKLQPSLSFHPVTLTDCAVVPEQEYRMQAKVDWMVPLAFDGPIDVEGIPTPPLTLDSAHLSAPANSTHQVTQIVGNDLPFDCRVTPVFTMNGKKPEYLDSFTLDRNTKVEFSLAFTPSDDDWSATLHYLVSPTRGRNEFIRKTDKFMIWNTLFTANIQK